MNLNTMYPASAFVGTVEVPEENGFLYGQDHAFHQGIPAGRYSVERFGEDAYKLTAPGYGMHGAYGNGALYVSDPANPGFANLLKEKEQHDPTGI